MFSLKNPAAGPALAQLSAAARDADWAAARPLIEPALAAFPTEPLILFMAAHIAVHGFNDPMRAETLLLRALETDPGFAPAIAHLSSVRRVLGDRTGALRYAERMLEIAPNEPNVYYDLVTLAPDRGAALQDRMEALAVSPEITEAGRGALFVALGRVYERQDRLDAAVTAYLAGKTFGAPAYQHGPVLGLLAACRQRYAPEAVAARADLGFSDERPVFIIGLPRSGTSLIERVLSAHDAVDSAGETPEAAKAIAESFPVSPVAGRAFFHEADGVAAADAQALQTAGRRYLERVAPYLRNRGAARWIDKMPGNILLAGAIATILPQARFILTDREPRDVMLSCLRVKFNTGQNFAQSFEAFAQYYAAQRAFADLWRRMLGDRLLTVRYEDLAANPEDTARRLVAHLDLPWRDACAQPQAQAGAMNTASALQVREAVHTRSIGGWRKFEAQFAPLSALLEAVEAERGRRAA